MVRLFGFPSLEKELKAIAPASRQVAAKFNDIVTERLVEGCLGALEARGVETEGVLVTWVPGSFEIPVVARRLASSGEFDAVIAVGCIIQGETAHYDAVVQAATSGIANASEATGVPVIFGVLTCETTEQAFDRAGGKLGNKGEDFAASAVHMGNLMRTLSIDYQL